MEDSGALKRVRKRIHLTLPASPTHVTTTETFMTFFINHGLTKALRKAFEKRGWSTDDMQALITNFQRKHGKKVPLSKIYMDEDSSDSEGLELEDGTRVGRKATGGSGGSGGGKPGRKPSAGGSGSSGTRGSGGGGDPGPSLGGSGAGGSGGTVVAPAEVPSMARMMTTPMTTPTNEGRQVILPRNQGNHWPGKSLEGQLHTVASTSDQEKGGGLLTLLLIETWLLFTFRRRKKGPSWGKEYWTGPKLSWIRYTRRGWKAGRSSHTGTKQAQQHFVTFTTSRRVQHSSSGSYPSRGW